MQSVQENNLWIEAIKIVAPILAIAVSILALINSRRSTRVAETSLLADKRPVIVINPHRSQTTGFFLFEKISNGFRVKISFLIENTGKSIASNINFAHPMKLGGPQNWDFSSVSSGTPPPVSLGPGQKQLLQIETQLQVEKGKLPDFNESQFSFNTQIVLDYESEHFPELLFRTVSGLAIAKESVQILRCDFMVNPRPKSIASGSLK